MLFKYLRHKTLQTFTRVSLVVVIKKDSFFLLWNATKSGISRKQLLY